MDVALKSVKAKFTSLISKEVPVASDHAAYLFLKSFHFVMVELQQKAGGDACYKYIFPDGSASPDILNKILSESAKKDVSSALIEILESTADGKTYPSLTKADGDALLQKIGSDMALRYGQDILVMKNPESIGIDKEKVCLMVTDMYDRILQLPPRQAGLLMKYMASNAAS